MSFVYVCQSTWRVLVVIAFTFCKKVLIVLYYLSLKLANLPTDVSNNDRKTFAPFTFITFSSYQLSTWCCWSFYLSRCHSLGTCGDEYNFCIFVCCDQLFRMPFPWYRRAWIFAKAAKNWECGCELKYSTCMCSAATLQQLEDNWYYDLLLNWCFRSSKTNLLQIGGKFLIFCLELFHPKSLLMHKDVSMLSCKASVWRGFGCVEIRQHSNSIVESPLKSASNTFCSESQRVSASLFDHL
jgi:hypothetical protein